MFSTGSADDEDYDYVGDDYVGEDEDEDEDQGTH